MWMDFIKSYHKRFRIDRDVANTIRSLKNQLALPTSCEELWNGIVHYELSHNPGILDLVDLGDRNRLNGATLDMNFFPSTWQRLVFGAGKIANVDEFRLTEYAFRSFLERPCLKVNRCLPEDFSVPHC